jgi:hypothetical protein
MFGTISRIPEINSKHSNRTLSRILTQWPILRLQNLHQQRQRYGRLERFLKV